MSLYIAGTLALLLGAVGSIVFGLVAGILDRERRPVRAERPTPVPVRPAPAEAQDRTAA
jgi:hypothetical protein